ncbi:MAG TPA: endo-1,4-beta-xylanase [Steroidobacteraceae bacterium]|nr:endo-1,4-beta-xylanase [Steroidobacteraceae bacterium]
MAGWSRRQIVRSGVAAAAAACAGNSFAATTGRERPEDSLDAIARRKGLRFGSALGGRGLRDPRYLELVTAQCGILVPENELKMTSVQREPGVFDFARAEALLQFAESHGMAVRGHTLLWHHPRWLPKWLETHDFGAEPATAAAGLLEAHIRKAASFFGRRIVSWDVVNEAVDNVTGAMRETLFSRAIGTPDQVVEMAFRIARAQLPDTELVYNDYMGWEKDSAAHRTGVLKLLERLRRNGAPVNALGLQSHIGCGNQDANAGREFDARDEREWRNFLREVTGMGYRLVITEFDVHDGALAASAKQRDRSIASLARAFLDLTLDFREVSAVLCWGLADNFSWLQGRSPRQEGVAKRPTPFDSHYRPKPMRDAIAAALRSAPSRRPVIPQGEPA